MNKALIVDDSEPNRRLPALILGQLGWATTEATDGHSALDAARLDTFDCILLDLMLPDLHGGEVCRRLRANAGAANAKTWIIAYTAETAERIEHVTSQCRFDALLTKPITRSSLLSALPPAHRAQG